MSVLKTILQIIGGFTGLYLAGMMIYQLILGFFGFGKKTKDYEDHDPESRFLVLVPAHNEEKVIRDIVQNLQEMDYPKKNPRKSYLAFSIVPIEMDLSFIVEHHLIESLIDLNAENAKGTPIFIES